MRWIQKITGGGIGSRLDKADRDRVHDLMREKNADRLRVIALLTVLLEALLILFYDLPALGVTGAFERWLARGYLIAHSSILLVALAGFLLLTLMRTHRSEWGPALFDGALHFLIIMLLVGIVLVTALDQMRTGQITAYAVNLLIAGTLLYIKPPQHLLVLGIPHLFFLYTVLLFGRDPLVVQANLINGTLLFVTIVVVTRFTYKAQFDRFATQLALERANEELQYLARYDQLTGLYNRRYFEEELDRRIEGAQDRGYLVICDVDHFKKINDTHGHPFGDRVLRRIAEMLREPLAPGDLIARWGGEEFILHIVDADPEQALSRVKGLREALDVSTLSIKGASLHVTASFGVVSLEERAVENALRLADDAMYRAKEKGRNRVMLARQREEGERDAT